VTLPIPKQSELPDTLPDGATFNFEPGDGSITINMPVTRPDVEDAPRLVGE
jgi:hypothetical protein